MLDIIKNFQDKKNREHILVYRAIREKQPVSKQQLKTLTGLKLTTLVRIMNHLLEAGLILVKNIGESSGGRKPLLYSVNPRAGFIIGININGMATKAALLDLDCKVIESTTFAMSGESTWENTLERICLRIDSMCSGIDREKILGIGVGAVGPIDRQKGIILNPANFPAKGWENVRVKEVLESRAGLVTILENGVNTSALAEHRSGYFKKYGSMAYILAGVSLRLGIIINHQLLNNLYSKKGSFGHSIINPDGKPCYCGNKGCLEAYASIPAIMDEFTDRIKAGGKSSMRNASSAPSFISFDAFCDAVDRGDTLAVKVVENAAGHFAAGVTNVINIVNPELVILGGPLIKKCNLFYRRSIEAINALLDNSYSNQTSICPGSLGDDAAVMGAGHLVLDHFLK